MYALNMRAVGYVRVSSEEQSLEGVSLGAQRSKLAAYCQVRDLNLVEVVEDAGVSGGKPLHLRPGGRRVIELAEQRGVGAVVALKLDRLFRNATDCLQVSDRWQRRNVALHLVDLGGQAVDTGSAAGRFFFLMLAGVAEMERGQVSERTKVALAHMKREGLRVGGIPFGMRCGDDGKLCAEPVEVAAVERAYELRSSGVSIRKIAAALQGEGFAHRGKRWHATTVARLLMRRR